MNYAEALTFLKERQETRWKLGLSRIESLVDRLGNPQEAFPIVHVAGTNGKGSFSAMLAAVLKSAGLKVGLFTSPHLITPMERIRIDGRPISGAELGVILASVRAAERERASYFELMTAVAFTYFKARKVDIAVIEVGLGGRLDATNIVRKPVLSVITSIDLDHTKHLGSTVGEIAGEKAGILKRGVPFLCGEEKAGPLEVLRTAAIKRCAILKSSELGWRRISIDWEGGRQVIESHSRRLPVGLLGDGAAKNAVLAARAVDILNEQGFSISESSLKWGLGEVKWPGRFQVLKQSNGRTMILDGAHNPAAMQSFADAWSQSPWQDEALFIFGVLQDKDYSAMIRRIAPMVARVIVTRPNSPRGLLPELAAKEFRKWGTPKVEIVSQGMEALARWRASETPTVVVLGSFYLVGEILAASESVSA